MLQFLPYALAAYGGYQGYRQAKDAGASGIGRLLGAAGVAYTGYNLGQAERKDQKIMIQLKYQHLQEEFLFY